MRSLFIVLSILTSSPLLNAQEKKAAGKVIKAEFPGGSDALYDFFYQNVKLPNRELSGATFIVFNIDIEGHVSDIKVVGEFEDCKKCDKEVVRVAKTMPAWKPATQDGKPVPDEGFFYYSFNEQPPKPEELQDVMVGSIEDYDAPPPLEEIVEIDSSGTIVEFPDQIADYNGGIQAMTAFLRENIRPAIADSVVGKVYLQLTIETDGKISKVEVARGMANCPQCDAEAVRVISIMPNWIPARHQGKIVRSRFNLPIKFSYN